MSNLDDSVIIAAMNRAKRKYFANRVIFSNVYEYVLFVMEIIEEYEFLSSNEKKMLANHLIWDLEMFENKSQLKSILIDEFIDCICRMSKKKKLVNKNKSITFPISCFSKLS